MNGCGSHFVPNINQRVFVIIQIARNMAKKIINFQLPTNEVRMSADFCPKFLFILWIG